MVNADPRKDENHDFLYPDLAVDNCKEMLYENRLLISDSLYRTNRKNQSSEDIALMIQSEVDYVNEIQSVNFALKDQLRENTTIESIYFTSTSLGAKSPYGWFRLIFGNQIQIHSLFLVGIRTWSAKATICFADNDVRNYNLFFLPTPKTRGIHWSKKRTLMFENFLKAQHNEFYQEINHIPVNLHLPRQVERLSELRSDFLIECYRQALIFSNLKFDGSNLCTKLNPD